MTEWNHVGCHRLPGSWFVYVRCAVLLIYVLFNDSPSISMDVRNNFSSSLSVVYLWFIPCGCQYGCTRCNLTLTWSVASFSVIWLPVPLEFGRCRSGDRSRAPLSLVSLVPHDSWPLIEWPEGRWNNKLQDALPENQQINSLPCLDFFIF